MLLCIVRMSFSFSFSKISCAPFRAGQEQLQCVARLGLLSQALLFAAWQRAWQIVFFSALLLLLPRFCLSMSFDLFSYLKPTVPTHSSKDECRGTFENAQAKSWMHQNIACSKCLQMKLMQSDAVRRNQYNREREREREREQDIRVQ